MGYAARLTVTTVLCAVSYGGCAAALLRFTGMDLGLALGWAALPLTIVAGIACPWAWEGRKPKESPATPATLARQVIVTTHGRLLSPVVNLLGPIINVMTSGTVPRTGPAILTQHRDAIPACVPGHGLVVGNIPGEPKAFQPRMALRAELDPAIAPVHVLVGPTGSGKTHLAAAYARDRMQAGWRLVAWVDAADSRLMVNGLAAVAARLGLAGPDETAESAADSLRLELARNGAQCLLVLDNVWDLDRVQDLLPVPSESHIVITSTRQAAANLGKLVRVGEFTMDEAVRVLREWTEKSDQAGSRKLADELGRLPLGLVQAAAVIKGQNLDYGTYLERLQTLPVSEYLAHVEGDRYPRGTAEAILLSLRGIETGPDGGLCGTVMDVLSAVSAAGVSRTMLTTAAAAGAIPGLKQGRWAAARWDAAVGRVADASLLAFSVNDSVIVHRLVMRVVRERQITAGTLGRVTADAVMVLLSTAEAIGMPWEQRAAIRELTSHIAALGEHVGPHLDSLDVQTCEGFLHLRGQGIALLNKLGDCSGQVIRLGQPLAADCGRLLGSCHRLTLDARHDLAVAYLAAGSEDRAVLLLEDVVQQRKRVLGNAHPDTLAARGNLARARLAAEQTDQAIPLLEEVAERRQHVLGESHPDTLTSWNDLGLAYRKAGRLDEAVTLLEYTLAEREKILEVSHPDLATSRTSLALAYLSQKRRKEAIALHERALTDREKILGADHIETLKSRNFLAHAYQLEGRCQDAIEAFGQALADARRVLGDDHPATRVILGRAAAAAREAEAHGAG